MTIQYGDAMTQNPKEIILKSRNKSMTFYHKYILAHLSRGLTGELIYYWRKVYFEILIQIFLRTKSSKLILFLQNKGLFIPYNLVQLFIKYTNPTFIKCIVCPKSDVVKIYRKFMFMTIFSDFAVYSQ